MPEIGLDVDTRELDKLLAALPPKISKQYLKTALEAGGDVILRAMVARAPYRTDDKTSDGSSLPPGILKADLTTDVKIFSDGGGGRVNVGPTQIAGYVARWQNNGWAVTTRGTHRKIKDKPGSLFMQGAYDESSESALQAFIENLK